MPIVYKYRPGRGPITKDPNDSSKKIQVFERDINQLSEDMIFVPTFDQLNDPTEALVDETKLKNSIGFLKHLVKDSSSITRVEDSLSELQDHLKTAGIYSLSKTATNELMWAYYANGHNGYAIEFDTDVLYKSLNGGTRYSNIFAFDINYVKSLPEIDLSVLYKLQGDDFMQKYTGFKSKSWEHEQEYRLVFNKGGELKHIDYRAIKGFVFGYLMPQEDIEYVMNLFKGRHLTYKKIKLNPKHYQFYTEEIEDIYKDAPNYHPSRVSYDFEKMIEESSLYDETVLAHKKVAKEALEIVACEPFVENIYLLLVSKSENNPDQIKITVGTDYKNPSVLQPKKIYRFIVDKDYSLIRTE